MADVRSQLWRWSVSTPPAPSAYIERSVAAISKATIAANLPTTKTISMKSNAIRQMFCERHLAGVLYRDIAKELGISLRTASNWAREMGLPRRMGGPGQKKWMPDKTPKIG